MPRSEHFFEYGRRKAHQIVYVLHECFIGDGAVLGESVDARHGYSLSGQPLICQHLLFCSFFIPGVSRVMIPGQVSLELLAVGLFYIICELLLNSVCFQAPAGRFTLLSYGMFWLFLGWDGRC